jgi:hypothetical protein
MSGVLGIERRRTGSIGIEEKALSTLEKFVELCDKGCEEEEEEHGDEGIEGSLDCLEPPTLGVKTRSRSNESISSTKSSKARLCELFDNLSHAEAEQLQQLKGITNKSGGGVEVETSQAVSANGSQRSSPTPTPPNGTTTPPNANTNGNLKSGTLKSTSPTQAAVPAAQVPIKKSEEIWVRRTAGGRRSFRVTVSPF